MGRESRHNPTSQAARRGELMSRATILGHMDHALEVHASSLKLAHGRIEGLVLRCESLERRLLALEEEKHPPLAFHPKAFEMVMQGLPTPTLDQIVEGQP